METGNMLLTKEDENLLLNVLFQQGYASELLACELADIESGLKEADNMHYLRVTSLFDRLRNADL